MAEIFDPLQTALADRYAIERDYPPFQEFIRPKG